MLSLDYDPDSQAGDIGTESSLPILQEHNIRAYVLPPSDLSDPNYLNTKEDPDSYVLKHGVEAYLKLLQHAIEPAGYLLERKLRGLNSGLPQNLDTGLEAASQILISTQADAITRASVIKSISQWANQPSAAIETRLAGIEQQVRAKIQRDLRKTMIAKATDWQPPMMYVRCVTTSGTRSCQASRTSVQPPLGTSIPRRSWIRSARFLLKYSLPAWRNWMNG